MLPSTFCNLLCFICGAMGLSTLFFSQICHSCAGVTYGLYLMTIVCNDDMIFHVLKDYVILL